MKRLEELVEKRKSELEEGEESIRRNAEKYRKAVNAGIIGGIWGTVVGFIIGIIATGLVALIINIITGDKEVLWTYIFLIGCTIGGAIYGYNSSFTNRINKEE